MAASAQLCRVAARGCQVDRVAEHGGMGREFSWPLTTIQSPAAPFVKTTGSNVVLEDVEGCLSVAALAQALERSVEEAQADPVPPSVRANKQALDLAGHSNDNANNLLAGACDDDVHVSTGPLKTPTPAFAYRAIGKRVTFAVEDVAVGRELRVPRQRKQILRVIGAPWAKGEFAVRPFRPFQLGSSFLRLSPDGTVSPTPRLGCWFAPEFIRLERRRSRSDVFQRRRARVANRVRRAGRNANR